MTRITAAADAKRQWREAVQGIRTWLKRDLSVADERALRQAMTDLTRPWQHPNNAFLWVRCGHCRRFFGKVRIKNDAPDVLWRGFAEVRPGPPSELATFIKTHGARKLSMPPFYWVMNPRPSRTWEDTTLNGRGLSVQIQLGSDASQTRPTQPAAPYSRWQYELRCRCGYRRTVKVVTAVLAYISARRDHRDEIVLGRGLDL